jgi:hypothetical protein
MVGPAALDFLTDFFCRHASSVEGSLLILQLAHFKHFDEPLTVFVRDELLGTSSTKLATKKLSDPKGIAFLTSLFSWSLGPQELASNQVDWPINDVAGLLASIAEARADFRLCLRRLKLAFGVLLRVRKTMLDLGYRSAEVDKTPLEMMSASLRGGVAREGVYLGMMTKSAILYSLATPSYTMCSGSCLRKSCGFCCKICSRSLTSFQVTWTKLRKCASAWLIPLNCLKVGRMPHPQASRMSWGIGSQDTSS